MIKKFLFMFICLSFISTGFSAVQNINSCPATILNDTEYILQEPFNFDSSICFDLVDETSNIIIDGNNINFSNMGISTELVRVSEEYNNLTIKNFRFDNFGDGKFLNLDYSFQQITNYDLVVTNNKVLNIFDTPFINFNFLINTGGGANNWMDLKGLFEISNNYVLTNHTILMDFGMPTTGTNKPDITFNNYQFHNNDFITYSGGDMIGRSTGNAPRVLLIGVKNVTNNNFVGWDTIYGGMSGDDWYIRGYNVNWENNFDDTINTNLDLGSPTYLTSTTIQRTSVAPTYNYGAYFIAYKSSGIYSWTASYDYFDDYVSTKSTPSSGFSTLENETYYLGTGYAMPIFGCTDNTANNYDSNANTDDGSCTYDIFGCMDINASNYDVTANIDDGSCTYIFLGCTNNLATNYNVTANTDDGSCVYPASLGNMEDSTKGLPSVGDNVGSFLGNLAPGLVGFLFNLGMISALIGFIVAITMLVKRVKL